MTFATHPLNKICFTSLGCSRNLVDTEVMLSLVLQAGFEVVAEYDEADVVVVNTCGFLASARQEAVDVFTDVFEEIHSKAKVIAVGCMVNSHKQTLEDAFPKMHAYITAGSIESIVKAIDNDTSFYSHESRKSFLSSGEIPRQIATPSHYAYIKIAEGCKKRCSYCIIPYIKGKLQSKSVDNVLREQKALIKSGVKELLLIAQDLGDYGKDQGIKNGLHSLLTEMDKVKGDYWIRLLYLYPDEINEDIISLLKESVHIIPYVDMPIQHINNTVLKNMHRKTTGQDIKSIITRLREEIPSITIRTSIMVGFPGETEEQFNELCDFITEYELDNVGFFTYSKEEQSYSAKLDHHIPEDVKQKRHDIIVSLQQKVVAKKNAAKIGKVFDVIAEGYHPESEYLVISRSKESAPDVDGTILINEASKIDAFSERYSVEITGVAGYDLIGKVLEKKPWNTKRSSLLSVIS